jgi:hypothetical protein
MTPPHPGGDQTRRASGRRASQVRDPRRCSATPALRGRRPRSPSRISAPIGQTRRAAAQLRHHPSPIARDNLASSCSTQPSMPADRRGTGKQRSARSRPTLPLAEHQMKPRCSIPRGQLLIDGAHRTEEDDGLRHRRYGLGGRGAVGPTRTAEGWEQGMRAARRPQGAVGLGAVELLAERAMRSGRRIGLVVGCLQGGEQRVVG